DKDKDKDEDMVLDLGTAFQGSVFEKLHVLPRQLARLETDVCCTYVRLFLGFIEALGRIHLMVKSVEDFSAEFTEFLTNEGSCSKTVVEALSNAPKKFVTKFLKRYREKDEDEEDGDDDEADEEEEKEDKTEEDEEDKEDEDEEVEDEEEGEVKEADKNKVEDKEEDKDEDKDGYGHSMDDGDEEEEKAEEEEEDKEDRKVEDEDEDEDKGEQDKHEDKNEIGYSNHMDHEDEKEDEDKDEDKEDGCNNQMNHEDEKKDKEENGEEKSQEKGEAKHEDKDDQYGNHMDHEDEKEDEDGGEDQDEHKDEDKEDGYNKHMNHEDEEKDKEEKGQDKHEDKDEGDCNHMDHQDEKEDEDKGRDQNEDKEDGYNNELNHEDEENGEDKHEDKDDNKTVGRGNHMDIDDDDDDGDDDDDDGECFYYSCDYLDDEDNVPCLTLDALLHVDDAKQCHSKSRTKKEFAVRFLRFLVSHHVPQLASGFFNRWGAKDVTAESDETLSIRLHDYCQSDCVNFYDRSYFRHIVANRGLLAFLVDFDLVGSDGLNCPLRMLIWEGHWPPDNDDHHEEEQEEEEKDEDEEEEEGVERGWFAKIMERGTGIHVGYANGNATYRDKPLTAVEVDNRYIKSTYTPHGDVQTLVEILFAHGKRNYALFDGWSIEKAIERGYCTSLSDMEAEIDDLKAASWNPGCLSYSDRCEVEHLLPVAASLSRLCARDRPSFDACVAKYRLRPTRLADIMQSRYRLFCCVFRGTCWAQLPEDVILHIMSFLLARYIRRPLA
ncbi:hypothetical protein CBR_g38711, partial [Chara braunii]